MNARQKRLFPSCENVVAVMAARMSKYMEYMCNMMGKNTTPMIDARHARSSIASASGLISPRWSLGIVTAVEVIGEA